MATQNSTITIKGKLGNIVGYKGRDGKRLARIRQTEVKNPKTKGQTIQRMIISTSARAFSRMKAIVDHSFQGVQYGGMSQSYFLKRASEDIRNWVAQTISITGEYPEALRNPLLYRGLSFPKDFHQSGVGLLISEGSLPTIEPHLVTNEGKSQVSYFGNVVPENPTIADVMSAFGAQRGDQITIVGLRNGSNEFLYSRYVIKADATDEELKAKWDSTGAAAAFDQVKTKVGGLQIQSTQDGMYPTEDLCYAAGVILSRKEGDIWQRSTQRLVWLSDAGEYTNTDVVTAEWMAGTTQIDTVSPDYLNQAEQAGL